MKLPTIVIIWTVGLRAYEDEPISNPSEVGDVRWGRDFGGALETSVKTAKPVPVLFQETPGCSDVRQFGCEVLTNPALVKAIESEFLPVVTKPLSCGLIYALPVPALELAGPAPEGMNDADRAAY